MTPNPGSKRSSTVKSAKWKAAVLLAVCSIAAAKASDSYSPLLATDMRAAIMLRPDGKACDAANWPVDHGVCQDLAAAVGVVMLQAAKESGIEGPLMKDRKDETDDRKAQPRK